MRSPKLQAALARIEDWPEAAQDQLAEIARDIEASLAGPYRAAPDELAGIDRGLADAAAGRMAEAEAVAAVLAKLERP